MVLYYDCKLMSVFNRCLLCTKKSKEPEAVPDVHNYRTNDGLGECIICYRAMGPGQNVLLISCGHVYHSWCLNAWFLKREVCPICQVPIEI